MSQPAPGDHVKIAVMGATGTGKSTFIRLLTNDDDIRIGHDPESETSDIQTSSYIDPTTGKSVMLIDTPGFDDSREGMTDTDVLKKIAEFLEPEEGQGKKLNGIIYMHRISDMRVGGLARKNIRMFQALCGEKTLPNVLVVTTNWEGVTKQDGYNREDHLKQGAFKILLDAKAQMRRHTNDVESARAIMSELIPLPKVTTRIQDQITGGTSLGATDAGRIINQQIQEMMKKHKEELANVKKEMEEACDVRDKALRDELEQETRALQAKIARADDDRAMLMKTLDEIRAELRDREGLQKMPGYDSELAALRRLVEELEVVQGRELPERARPETPHDDEQRELLMKTIEDLRAERAAYKQEKQELQKKYEDELNNLKRLLEANAQARGPPGRRFANLFKKFCMEYNATSNRKERRRLWGGFLTEFVSLWRKPQGGHEGNASGFQRAAAEEACKVNPAGAK